MSSEKAEYTPSKEKVRVHTCYSRSKSQCDRTIVLAVDISDNAKAAFHWYLKNIHRPDDLIVLTHFPEMPRLPNFSFKSGITPPVQDWKTALDEMNSKTRKLETDYETTCIERKLHYKLRGEATKNPGEGIVRIGHEEDADLIVLGTRGLSAVKRVLLGSVSEYVVRHASCPLVIVPASHGQGKQSE